MTEQHTHFESTRGLNHFFFAAPFLAFFATCFLGDTAGVTGEIFLL